MRFRNVSLVWKLVAVAVLTLGPLTAHSVVSLTGTPAQGLTVGLLAGAYVLGGGIALLTARELSGGFKGIVARLDAVEEAAKERLMGGLKALAAGDLTVELHASTATASDFAGDEIGQVMRHIEIFRAAIIECYDAYNQTVETLRKLMASVTKTAEAVAAASQEMASTSEQTGRATDQIARAVSDVAEGAERQARMADTARRSAEEIAHAVGESAKNAELAAEVANSAHEAAQRGVDASEQANQAMHSVRDSSAAVTDAIGELAGKSEQIGQIVETITRIAEQTNLLALNAAIEAARAGDHGRGFAVVAEEVRKLAEDSQRAAREISGLIGSMQSETTKAVAVVQDGAKRTQEGATVVEQTREAFLSIGAAVEDMASRIEHIAAAAQQIMASATGMQQNVGEVAVVAERSSASTQEVSASTEQTSASAQQIAASAQQLAENAGTLDGLVTQFKLA